MNYNKKGISLIEDGTKKAITQNTKIKFKQIKHKILSKRKQKFHTYRNSLNKKITIIQKNISRTVNLTALTEIFILQKKF